MEKKGCRVQVWLAPAAAVFSVFVTLSSLEVAVSSDSKSTVRDSTSGPFGQDGQDAVHHGGREAVWGETRESRHEQFRLYSTGSERTVEKPWRYSMMKRRHRGSPARSSIYWRPCCRNVLARSTVAVSILAATLITAAMLVFWRLGTVLISCLKQESGALKYAGPTARLLSKSEEATARYEACIEAAKEGMVDDGGETAGMPAESKQRRLLKWVFQSITAGAAAMAISGIIAAGYYVSRGQEAKPSRAELIRLTYIIGAVLKVSFVLWTVLGRARNFISLTGQARAASVKSKLVAALLLLLAISVIANLAGGPRPFGGAHYVLLAIAGGVLVYLLAPYAKQVVRAARGHSPGVDD